MSELPKKITQLATLVMDAGGRAMLVGGCVRDDLMGIEPKDFDIEVFGVAADQLKTILSRMGRVDTVGESFTVYKLGNDLDVSLPRRERKVSRGHKGFIVEGDPLMSFEEAARRRDFTINAIMRDVITGEVVDPFNGRADLQRRVIRHIADETFVEDSLRVLRAAQFAARFEFEIDAETVSLCRTIDLTDLPKERLWGEIEKLLLRAEKPSIGLKYFYELGIADQLFPELTSMIGVPQEPEWHPEGDVDVHTMLVTDEARKLIDDLPYPKQVAVMLGAVCHDFGKPATTQFFDGRWRAHGHDEAGVEPTINFLDKLGVYTLDGYDVRNQIIQLVRYHLTPGMFFKSKPGDGALRRLARKVEPDLLYRVAKADSLGRNPEWIPKEKWLDAEAQEWFIERVKGLHIETRAPEPLLLGRHLIQLGLQPSRIFGDITKTVYEMQLDGKITTVEEAVAEAEKIINEKGYK